MKRPNITPGPWKEARKSHFCIVGKGGTFVADMRPWASAPGLSTPRQEANARAIAALPNLLDTLEACLQSLEDCWKLTNGECGGTRDIGTRNLIGEKIDWIKTALRLAGYEF